MTKHEALEALAAVYSTMNRADGDADVRPDWTHPSLASTAGCGLLDHMVSEWRKRGVLSDDEVAAFYASIC